MKKLFFSLGILLGIINLNAQQCSLLEIGDDVYLDCLNNTTLLETSFMDGFWDPSDIYTITNVTPCPLPPNTSGTQTSITTDDVWSNTINLPFNFVYFGNTYSQILVGANGIVSFDINRSSPQAQQPGAYCAWGFSESLPSPNLFRNTIFGAYHDLDVSANTGGTIEYYVSGTAPQRIFVVSYTYVPHFSCTSMRTTQRVLLYETTNVIDVQITRKDLCSSWNNGNAVIGIQNEAGDVAYVPAGRNTGAWRVTNEELWRFTPNDNGPIQHTTTWYDDTTNAVLGTGDSFLFVYDPNLYSNPMYIRCEVEYTDAGGVAQTLTDRKTIYYDGTIEVPDLGPDQSICDNVTMTLDGTTADATGYQWQLNGTDIPGETNPTLDITGPGTYTINVVKGICSASDEIVITSEPTPIVSLPADYHFCEGGTETLTAQVSNPSGNETYQWYQDGTPIASATTNTLDVTGTGTYMIEVTNTIGCIGSDEITLTMDPYPDLELGKDQVVCAYDTAVIASNITDADTYTWEVNGVTDPNTTDTLSLTGSGSYDVVLTIDRGTCTVSDTVHITILDPVNIVATPVIYGELDIDATGGLPPYQYSLDNNTFQSSNIFTELPDGDYPIWITDDNGCVYEFPPVHVINLIFPKFVTPNGDGYNDQWRVEHAENTPDAVIYIYDRFGRLVKQMHTKSNEAWDGTYNGTPLAAADYWFMLQLPGGRTYKGHFSVKR